MKYGYYSGGWVFKIGVSVEIPRGLFCFLVVVLTPVFVESEEW